MNATDIQKDDEFIGNGDRHFWTATGPASEPTGDGYVYVPVREARSGRETHRWLPVGVELPIRRPGVSP